MSKKVKVLIMHGYWQIFRSVPGSVLETYRNLWTQSDMQKVWGVEVSKAVHEAVLKKQYTCPLTTLCLFSCLANCGLSLSCWIQIFTLNAVNSPPAALVPTTFDSKYIIHKSFIDNLWTQRSDVVHICKDNDNVREHRKLNTACYPLREGYVVSYLCQ